MHFLFQEKNVLIRTKSHIFNAAAARLKPGDEECREEIWRFYIHLLINIFLLFSFRVFLLFFRFSSSFLNFVSFFPLFLLNSLITLVHKKKKIGYYYFFFLLPDPIIILFVQCCAPGKCSSVIHD